MKLDLTIDIDPDNLAKEVRRLNDKDRRGFVQDFLAALDADSYHYAAQFIVDNPDEAVECPRCKRHTNKHAPKGQAAKCDYCAMVLP